MDFYLVGSTGIRWNQLIISKQDMLSVEMESEKNSDWKDHSDWLADNNKHTSSGASLDRDFLSRVM